jgi:hypothetical protein
VSLVVPAKIGVAHFVAAEHIPKVYIQLTHADLILVSDMIWPWLRLLQ